MSSSKPKESKWSPCSNEDFQNYYNGEIASGKPFCLEVRSGSYAKARVDLEPESKQNTCKNCSSRLGVKVRNMKMDFNTGGTWVLGRAMNTNDENL